MKLCFKLQAKIVTMKLKQSLPVVSLMEMYAINGILC